jgi:2-Cys peroxiredoxin 5
VHFIADDKGAFTTKLGFLFDASGLLGGPRAKRFVIIAVAGKVTNVLVEEDPTLSTITTAENVLTLL